LRWDAPRASHLFMRSPGPARFDGCFPRQISTPRGRTTAPACPTRPASGSRSYFQVRVGVALERLVRRPDTLTVVVSRNLRQLAGRTTCLVPAFRPPQVGALGFGFTRFTRGKTDAPGRGARSDLTRGQWIFSRRVLTRRRPVPGHPVGFSGNRPAADRASREAARRVKRLQRTVAVARFAGERRDHVRLPFRSLLTPASRLMSETAAERRPPKE
jgi:hypothetical protein